MKNYLSANSVFTEIGMTVPEVIGHGRSEDALWLLESRVEGTIFRDLLPDVASSEKAASSLARLHGHERRRYGDYRSWGGFRLTLRWRQRLRERWNKVIRLIPELECVTEDVRTWFEEWADSYSPRLYQLLHGDYHPGNLALTLDGGVAFLDLRTPKFGFGILEMIEAAHHFQGEEPADWEPFSSAYLGCRDEETRYLFKRFGSSLHAVFHLRHADRFSDLAVGDRGELEDRRRWERNAYDSFLRFCSITGIIPPAVDLEPESAFPSRREYAPSS